MTWTVTVVGIGEDGLEGIAVRALGAIETADIVVGGDRHLAMLPAQDNQARWSWGGNIGTVVERIAAEADHHRIVVLATGEPLWHGIGTRLIERLGAERIDVLPAPGAFSLGCARLGWHLDDPMLSCVSVHAKPFESLAAEIAPSAKLLILCRDGKTPVRVAALLRERGYGTSPVSVLERMGGSAERRVDGLANDDWSMGFDNLSVVAVQCVAGTGAVRLSRAPGLADDTFDHDGTITKSEVRAVTISALAPIPGEMLWDVGAGNGSIAIEWRRVCPAARAVAIEHDGTRAERIRRNAARLGVPALTVVEGRAPEALAGLPAPDAVFIGGGIASSPDMIERCMAFLPPGGRIVANAVTLEAQSVLLTAHGSLGGELIRIGIQRAEAVGGLSAMKPLIDVLQWRGRKA